MTEAQTATLKNAMARYMVVKLDIYRKRLGFEYEAEIAASFAVDDAMADFKSRSARSGFDSALSVFAMDIEDAQTALAQLQGQA
jgi:hypothetical protein